jgi:hypothetical protein
LIISLKWPIVGSDLLDYSAPGKTELNRKNVKKKRESGRVSKSSPYESALKSCSPCQLSLDPTSGIQHTEEQGACSELSQDDLRGRRRLFVCTSILEMAPKTSLFGMYCTLSSCFSDGHGARTGTSCVSTAEVYGLCEPSAGNVQGSHWSHPRTKDLCNPYRNLSRASLSSARPQELIRNLPGQHALWARDSSFRSEVVAEGRVAGALAPIWLPADPRQ